MSRSTTRELARPKAAPRRPDDGPPRPDDNLSCRDRRRKVLCGCWNSVNTHPHLDLRESPMHGWPGHANHADTVHAWCGLCAPNAFRGWPERLAALDARRGQ